MKTSAALLGALLVLTACGGPTGPNVGSGEKPDRHERDERHDSGPPDAPPPVTIRYFDDSAQLEPWTYCYDTGCADGAPRKPLLDIGDPSEVIVEYPLEDWNFEATFTPAGERCGRDQHVSLEDAGDGVFLLRPSGYADTYDVTLFGKGGGDLFVSFRWTTPHDGPLPAPTARAAIIADHDGEPDSYGIELQVTNLAATPKDASASITVEAGNGKAITFDAKRARGCWPEGTVYWDGPDDKGLAAAKLGPFPFHYTVELTLDDERYVAQATYPDDEIQGNEPSVALDFTPELPALQPRG